ncbi:hypothetical protein ISCU110981_15710 [Isoptericola cucumis]
MQRRVVDGRAARRAALAAGADTGPDGEGPAPAAGETPDHVVVARGWPAHLTFWCVVVGSLALLLTLAYWGVYQLGI